jgi:hemerythrin-like metal-binding protein
MNLPLMDETHQEFVALLADVQAAGDAELVNRWDRLVEHTQDHFDREDQWMEDTRFARSNCHSSQHEVVLNVMKEGTRRGQLGELEVIRQMASELVVWFPAHAQAMDAALATHLQRVRYDPITGVVHAPEALPAEEIHGCGDSTCSPSSTQVENQTAEEQAA